MLHAKHRGYSFAGWTCRSPHRSASGERLGRVWANRKLNNPTTEWIPAAHLDAVVGNRARTNAFFIRSGSDAATRKVHEHRGRRFACGGLDCLGPPVILFPQVSCQRAMERGIGPPDRWAYAS
ncbi:hypothetical protein MPSD_10850 [Mycobacterium pseudoshottsii JCM 15466]|nr:hypothetical protein MPSD_10850 [Mycobacterium pseudoshottsii JCM 15466]